MKEKDELTLQSKCVNHITILKTEYKNVSIYSV